LGTPGGRPATARGRDPRSRCTHRGRCLGGILNCRCRPSSARP
jgi:hypothetical protein